MSSAIYAALTAMTVFNNKGEQKKVSDLQYKYVGIYFTASWCRACTFFAPLLKRTYLSVNQNSRTFEIVNATLDGSLEDFSKVGRNYPWWTGSNMDFMQQLTTALRVQFIPKLVVYNSSGKMISAEGVNDIKRHQENVVKYWDSL